ncbi:Serine/threonine-protein kinase PknB [Luteitalea pratensis]|uniref:Serine/threonine-protein kinase PknB n=1 Tax=Luteitalea pratensis TaxID=1855912 RepID=A0A143PPQ6_LUTPR|nr:serine/threonine-protein kinase [Luteitalea pratensis]AMY10555.1 Serine/threonine-protein kinase PknB [Luteitalea pratensis]
MQDIVRATTPGQMTAGPEEHDVTMSPRLVSQATRRLCWVSLLAATTTVFSFVLQRVLQPEVVPVQQDPVNSLALLANVLFAAGLIAAQRYRVVPPATILQLGMLFEVVVAFSISTLETSLPFDPGAFVRGGSNLAVWIIIVGFLVPTRPIVTLSVALLAASMWPFAYFMNMARLDLPPLPLNRLIVWVTMPYLAALWAYFIAKRVQGMEFAAQKAQDLGSYHLESLIGRGGMGEVWRARHKMLAREAAIKIIRPELVQGASARQADVAVRRFEREARVTADLQSPHTVYLYDFGTSREGHFYFVMELLDGVSLQKLVQTFGPQPGSRVIHLLRQVCLSLEEAHASGLVHRDLKPSNIMACKVALQHDFVKVLDFGLVKPTQAEEFTHLTVEGVSAGTPGYIAPEIAMGEERIDGRADIYTLGCVAYFLLTGTLVFTETSPTAMAVAHVQKAPAPPSERTELPVSPDLEKVVLQCLAKKAADRPASARALIRLLDACVDAKQWCSEDADAWWRTHLPPSSSHRTPALEPDALLQPSPVLVR